MFNCKAVIFDMDGVIIDSEGLWRQAQQGALARWGASVSDEECIQLTKGKRLDEIARTRVRILSSVYYAHGTGSGDPSPDNHVNC